MEDLGSVAIYVISEAIVHSRAICNIQNIVDRSGRVKQFVTSLRTKLNYKIASSKNKKDIHSLRHLCNHSIWNNIGETINSLLLDNHPYFTRDMVIGWAFLAMLEAEDSSIDGVLREMQDEIHSLETLSMVGMMVALSANDSLTGLIKLAKE